MRNYILVLALLLVCVSDVLNGASAPGAALAREDFPWVEITPVIARSPGNAALPGEIHHKLQTDGYCSDGSPRQSDAVCRTSTASTFCASQIQYCDYDQYHRSCAYYSVDYNNSNGQYTCSFCETCLDGGGGSDGGGGGDGGGCYLDNGYCDPSCMSCSPAY